MDDRTAPLNGSTDRGADTVRRLAVEDIVDLRRRVLRRGTPVSHANYAEDADPTAVHLGIVRDDCVVATSTWVVRECPDVRGITAMQLKGMAVDDALQGQGLGRLLLEAGLRHARGADASLVWARARDSALGFYETCGFDVIGPAFIDDITGLSHHVVVRRLPSSQ